MDPVLFSLLIAFFLVKNTTQDLVYKATGKMPPSYLRDEARRKAREERAARRRAKGDGPIKRFLANELEQALADATEKRNRAREKKRAKRRAEWAEDDAYEENQRRPAAPAEEPAPEPVKVPCGGCGQALTGGEIAGYSDTADPLCATCRTSRTDGHQAKRCGQCDVEIAGDGPLCWVCESRSQDTDVPPQPAAGQGPQPAEDRQDTPDMRQPDPAPADVIDINQWRPRAAMPEPIKEADMSGETPNLTAALTYTNDMSTQCAAGAASVETSIASLRAGGVTGPSIDALVQAQEALRMAMEQFNTAHTELTRHITVKEAYHANADAGDKQFVTQD